MEASSLIAQRCQIRLNSITNLSLSAIRVVSLISCCSNYFSATVPRCFSSHNFSESVSAQTTQTVTTKNRLSAATKSIEMSTTRPVNLEKATQERQSA